MPTVEALSRINHDNVEYKKGDTFTCTDDEARDLIEAGVAVTSDKVSTANAPVESDDSYSETRFKVENDVFDVRVTEGGTTQYVKNGKLIKKAEYAAAKETATETPSEQQPQQ